MEQILKDFEQSVSTYFPIFIFSRINSNEKYVSVEKYFTACFNKAKEVCKAYTPVFAKEFINTDAKATGILVRGLEKGKKFLQKHNELEAYLIYSDDNGMYQIYQTDGLKNNLNEVKEQE